MSFVVFNVAHKKASIRADGPSIRILGRYINEYYALSAARERPYETRVWPVSHVGGPHESVQIHWRPITNINLSVLSNDEAHEALEHEYASVEARKSKWTSFRNSVERDVLQAAENHVLRPVDSIRGTSLMEAPTNVRPAPTEDSLEGPNGIEVVDPVVKPVPDQMYMILGIHGDADFEIQKQQHLESLGRAYKLKASQFLGLTDDSAVERAFAQLPEDRQHEFWTSFEATIVEHKTQMDALVQEPMVAFFDVSYDYTQLKDKVATYAEHPDLRHIDLAVVKMYSWLRLDLGPKFSKQVLKKTEGHQKELATEFFQAMQKALH